MARGRPRSFDPDAVLDEAVDVLWRAGPHAVSLNDLSRDLGVTKPALAAVFGGKEELLATVLRRYYTRIAKHADPALAVGMSPESVGEAYIRAFAGLHAEKAADGPKGCLLAAASETFACVETGPVREAIDELNALQFTALRDALAGVGAPDPDGEARFVLGQIVALAFFARAGVSAAERDAFVERAIAAVRAAHR